MSGSLISLVLTALLATSIFQPHQHIFAASQNNTDEIANGCIGLQCHVAIEEEADLFMDQWAVESSKMAGRGQLTPGTSDGSKPVCMPVDGAMYVPCTGLSRQYKVVCEKRLLTWKYECEIFKAESSSKKQYPTIIEELCRQFSLEDLKKSTNNFDEDRKIGESQYSIVYKGYLKHNGENDYPIALMRMRNMFDGWFHKEIELNCQLCHPNLTSFIGFCDEKDEKILVYRKDDILNGSLYDHLLSRDMESLSWKKRLEICIGAAKGLHYLHTGAKRAIFHRDVMPANILLDNSMVPKLWQLGFSLQGKISNSNSKPIEVDFTYGTFGYMAPESFKTQTFTDKCDVYSFGMVLLNVACTNYKHTVLDKIHMFEDQIAILVDKSEYLEEIKFNRDNFHEKFLDADQIIDPILMRLIAPPCLAVFKDIVKRCLKYDPNERPAMGEVEVELEHALALQQEWEK